MDKIFRILKNNLYALAGKDIVRIDEGKGCYREVYKIVSNIEDTTSYKNCVLKYAKDDSGQVENNREFETWQAVKGTKSEKYFCPIRNTSPNNKFIIMDWAKTKRNYNSGDAHNLENEIREDINLDKINRDNGHDIHYKNIGYYPPKDRMVVIDYSWGANFDMFKSNS